MFGMHGNRTRAARGTPKKTEDPQGCDVQILLEQLGHCIIPDLRVIGKTYEKVTVEEMKKFSCKEIIKFAQLLCERTK